MERCDVGDRFSVLVEGRCARGGEPPQGRDLFPDRVCPLAFHAAYPYFLTVACGGRFAWLREGEGVLFRCPSPAGSLEMRLGALKVGVARVEILRATGGCVEGHRVGTSFTIGGEGFCHRALGALTPYLQLVAWGGELRDTALESIRCPVDGCGARFQVVRT